MIVAVAIIPCDAVLICRVVPQVQIAVRAVVTIRLVVPCTAKPPRRAICSLPSGLSCRARGHCAASAPTTTVLRAGYIDDPMWTPKLCGRTDESLPIFARRRGEKLGACWAAVLLSGLADIQATLALEQDTCRIFSCKLDLLAHAS